MSKLIECKTCGKEVAKSAKKCPHCGKKLKMGLIPKMFIGLAVFGLILAVAAPSREDEAKSRTKIANAQVEKVDTYELAQIFNMMSEHTDLQRDNKEEEIKGKIVQWKLEVYEVSKVSDGVYRIQTSSSSNMPGTFLKIYARNENEKNKIESLKTGSYITAKGKVDGTLMRNIEVEPAFLM